MRHHDWRRRSTEIERMDRPDAPESELFHTLRQFERVNRWFTRSRGALEKFVLRPMRRAPDRRWTLADLGAGGCDLPRWLVQRCRREGLRLTVRAIERDPRVRRYAESANAGFPEIELIAADALDADAWGCPDFVFANHLLHHLADEQIVELLRRLDESGARYVLNDIVRTRWAVAPYVAVVAPFFPDSFLLEDGCISIRRAFTRDDWRRYIEAAGIGGRVRLFRRFPFRWIAVGGPDPALPPFGVGAAAADVPR